MCINRKLREMWHYKDRIVVDNFYYILALVFSRNAVIENLHFIVMNCIGESLEVGRTYRLSRLTSKIGVVISPVRYGQHLHENVFMG